MSIVKVLWCHFCTRNYTTAVLKFYAFCNAGNWAELKQVTAVHKRKSGTRVASFHREAVEKVITYCASLHGDLFAFRDRAFVLTLADTGLRISEACALKCGDLDWQEARTLIPGKRGKQAIVRFSSRAMHALQDYLHAREQLSAIARTPFEQQPLFVRHDIRASKMVRPVSAGGMWKAIKARITEAGIDRRLLRIQDFRQYFVTMVHLARGDLKLSQELARHESISSTSRYAHFGEGSDVAYDEIFNRRS